MSSPFDKEINDAINSADPGTQLEGAIAKFVKDSGYSLVSFRRKESNIAGGIGDVDLETDKAIIEVTRKKQGKLSQLQKLQSDSQLNPYGKPVILFAPYYKPSGVNSIKTAGFLVAQDFKQLLDILAGL